VLHKTIDVFSNVFISPPIDVEVCRFDYYLSLSPSTETFELRFNETVEEFDMQNDESCGVFTLQRHQDTLTVLTSNLNAVQHSMTGTKKSHEHSTL